MLQQTYRYALILLALLALVVAACSDDDSGATAGGASPTATTAIPRGSGRVLLATTTSTQDSGLLDVLEPAFEKATGYDLQVVAVGSGAALKMGETADADVLLVHSPAAEEQFMKDGFGQRRLLVMHNDFVVAGPANDPAKLAGARDSAEAFRRIAEAKAPFISRGDESGTHAREKSIWKTAGVEPKGQAWYSESGQGMGATLNIASQRRAYTLSDRATYLAQKKNVDLAIVGEGDAGLLNIYHVVTLNGAKHVGKNINAKGADAFADFLAGKEAQEMIRTFGVEKFGAALFFPDAGKQESDVTKTGGR